MFRLLNGARERSRKLGIDCDLDIAWMMENFASQMTCPILGTELAWGSNQIRDESCTLDRFDPSKGYNKENVWLISNLANRMKNSANLEQLIRFSDYWIGRLR